MSVWIPLLRVVCGFLLCESFVVTLLWYLYVLYQRTCFDYYIDMFVSML